MAGRDIHCAPCSAKVSETTAHKCSRPMCPARQRAREIEAERANRIAQMSPPEAEARGLVSFIK